eukprot:12365513-Ditylum_brightwellii.AAC.1
MRYTKSGNKLHEKLHIGTINNRHIMKLVDQSSNDWINDTLSDIYTNILNLSMRIIYQDSTVSDAAILQLWTLNFVIDQQPATLRLSDGK